MASKKSLEAAAATSGMFTDTVEQKKPKTVYEQSMERKNDVMYLKAIEQDSEPSEPKYLTFSSHEKEAETKAEPKRETATFSVKIGTDTLKKWRIYASMDGYGDKGKLTEQALIEYMNSHKLSPEQQKKMDTLLGL